MVALFAKELSILTEQRRRACRPETPCKDQRSALAKHYHVKSRHVPVEGWRSRRSGIGLPFLRHCRTGSSEAARLKRWHRIQRVSIYSSAMSLVWVRVFVVAGRRGDWCKCGGVVRGAPARGWQAVASSASSPRDGAFGGDRVRIMGDREVESGCNVEQARESIYGEVCCGQLRLVR